MFEHTPMTFHKQMVAMMIGSYDWNIATDLFLLYTMVCLFAIAALNLNGILQNIRARSSPII